jgi:hypothetical protein
MAEKKFFVDINLQGSALTNAKIGTNTGIGSTEGAFGYDSGSHRLQYFNGTATQNVANLSDISAVTGGLIFQGGYDPTTDTPDITDGSALKGYFWVATEAGTFLGESVQVGDSIVAKVDAAGATIADWLILQGNIVIATDSVDGIVRLGTNQEVLDGTESGAVVVTPATLQDKVDVQITPAINSKLSLSGGNMEGNINMQTRNITNVSVISVNGVTNGSQTAGFDFLGNDLSLSVNKIINLTGAPTDGTDVTNKTYVDGAASTAQSNAEATASADATTKANAAQAAAESYADTGLATKLDLAGGTMSGDINMNGNNIDGVDTIYTSYLDSTTSQIYLSKPINAKATHKITNLPAPTDEGDATNKLYVDGAASDAQAAANAYADSLAPNYDAAGSAATAESNANVYTDARSTAVIVFTGDWTDAGGYYYKEVNHGINNANVMVTTLYDNRPADFDFEILGGGILTLYSNILPASNVQVNVMKVS